MVRDQEIFEKNKGVADFCPLPAYRMIVEHLLGPLEYDLSIRFVPYKLLVLFHRLPGLKNDRWVVCISQNVCPVVSHSDFSIEKSGSSATLTRFDPFPFWFCDLNKAINSKHFRKLKDEYLKQATQVIQDPNILVNVISRRVKQLKHGSRPLVESLEKLNPEDIALREVIEGKITYQLFTGEE